MPVAALPYTLLLVLAEVAVGATWVTLASDLRGGVTRGFVLTMALCVALAGAAALWVASGVVPGTEVDGYRLEAGWFREARAALALLTGLAGAWAFAAFMGWDAAGRFTAMAASAAGAVALALLAAMLAPPAWGYPGVLAALVAGALLLGAVSVSMTWGHWYLTEGALPTRPLRDLALLSLVAVVVQAVVVASNAALPAREAPAGPGALDAGLIANPAFYLRLGVGLAFPAVLAAMALATARQRSMQSATGLLYICMAAVFTGEVLGRGLMFVTGKPL